MLWGHVDHQGHGGVGLLLVTGRKQAEALLGPVRHRVQTSDWAVGARPGSPKQCRFSPPEGGILTQRLDEPFVWTFYHDEGDPRVWRGADLFRQNL